jgi:large-conductance mechanosensitive channel
LNIISFILISWFVEFCNIKEKETKEKRKRKIGQGNKKIEPTEYLAKQLITKMFLNVSRF